MSEKVLLRIENGIGEIILNQPEILNPLSIDVLIAIIDYLDQLEKDDNVRVIVLKGEGPNFSAGGNVKDFVQFVGKGFNLDDVELYGKTTKKVRSVLKPVVAAVKGVAAGAGGSLILASDFRIANEDAKLVPAFIKLGVNGDSGMLYFLTQMLGQAKATELMMLGEPLSATEAKRLGLFNKVVLNDDFEKTLNKFVLQLANGPTKAYAKQKDLFNQLYYDKKFDDYIKKEAEYMADSTKTEDFGIGLNALIKREIPKFQGK